MRNNLYSSCLSLMLTSVLFSGCAGISFMELQDAETLGEGHSSIAAMASTGVNTVELYKDKQRDLGKTTVSISLLEFNYQTALKENFDFGLSLWNSSLLVNIVPIGKHFDSYYDIGVKFHFKRRITPQDNQRNFSLGATFLSQIAGYEREDQSWKSVLFGIAPAIMYSRRIYSKDSPIDSLHRIFPANLRVSFYAGLKTYFIFTNITYLYPHSSQEVRTTMNPIVFDPYIGFCVGNEKRHSLELHLIIMKNAFSGLVDVQPHIGIGTRIMF